MRARELGAGSDRDDYATLGDPVDGRQLVRERDGMPKQRQQNSGAERDATRRSRNTGEERQWLASRTRKQRVARPHRVISVLLGLPCRFDDKSQVAVGP
jgi:hypothetical protein